MAKRKKGKVIQMLSPKKYIKQKARNLPIHECWINNDWQESGIGNVFVTRKHSNGNLTVGIYLIDIKCLGVKDTHYLFSISAFEFKYILDKNNENMDMEKIEYKLAHNIIFGGLEFAEDYRFEAHQDFALTKYILEEDTEEIELIDIECGGDNGQPLYIRGPLDSDVRAAQIIAHLEKTAGKGNYDFINVLEDNEWDDDREPREKEIDEVEERLGTLSLQEKIEMFHSLEPKLEKLSEDEKAEFGYLIQSIIEEYTDFEEVEKVFEVLSEKMEQLEISEYPSDELLGVETFSGETDKAQFAEIFLELYYLILGNPQKAKKKLRTLQKEMPGNPAVAFLNIQWLQTVESIKHDISLEKYYKLFPEYPLIRIYWEINMQLKGKQKKANQLFKLGPKVYFPQQKSWHEIEVLNYLLLLTFACLSENNLNFMMVLDWLIEEIEISETEHEIVSRLIFVARIQFIAELEV